MTHLEGKLLSPMAWETAAPACPGGRATQCGNTDLAVRAGGIALPARPGRWIGRTQRAGHYAASPGAGQVRRGRGPAATGEVRSVAGACRRRRRPRSEEHTSELPSIMRIPNA